MNTEKPGNMNVILLDNQDSFVYNLADALHVMGARVQVYRNTLPAAQVRELAEGKLLCLSPGPGTPRDSGCLMELIELAWGKIPMLGVCLGFQAMLEHCGVAIERVGPVHGQSSALEVSSAGQKIFGGELAPRVARYHSLGTHSKIPEGWEEWGRSKGILMAGGNHGAHVAGFQFHPESILTPGGEQLLHRALSFITS